jgi:hypothetical protein
MAPTLAPRDLAEQLHDLAQDLDQAHGDQAVIVEVADELEALASDIEGAAA